MSRLHTHRTAASASPRAAWCDASHTRRNNFDAIRFALALLVVFDHARALSGVPCVHLPGSGVSIGHLAVDGFFVISGFLILASWERTPNIRSFLRNRLLRIYPGWLAAFAFCVLVVAPAGGMTPWMLLQPDYLASQSLRALVLSTPQGPGAFEHQPYRYLNGSMWTIRYEFLCYLCVAALGTASVARLRITWALLLGGGAIGSALHATGAAAHLPGDIQQLASGGFVGQGLRFVSFFAAGALFHACRDVIPRTTWLAMVAAALFVFGLVQYPAGTALVGPCALSYLIFWVAYSSRIRLYEFAKYGDFSYGIYLYGWPIQQLVVRYLAYGDDPNANFLISAPLAGGAGVLSWYFIERPMLRRKASSREFHPPSGALPQSSGDCDQ